MGFYSDLMGFYTDLMGFYSDLMGFYSDLMGFYSDSMGYEWDYPLVMTNIANWNVDHLVFWFTELRENVIFHFAMLVYQMFLFLIDNVGNPIDQPGWFISMDHVTNEHIESP